MLAMNDCTRKLSLTKLPSSDLAALANVSYLLMAGGIPAFGVGFYHREVLLARATRQDFYWDLLNGAIDLIVSSPSQDDTLSRFLDQVDGGSFERSVGDVKEAANHSFGVLERVHEKQIRGTTDSSIICLNDALVEVLAQIATEGSSAYLNGRMQATSQQFHDDALCLYCELVSELTARSTGAEFRFAPENFHLYPLRDTCAKGEDAIPSLIAWPELVFSPHESHISRILENADDANIEGDPLDILLPDSHVNRADLFSGVLP